MKTVFKFLPILAIALLTTFTASAQKRNITLKELPATAQTFIKTHFPNQATSYIVEDKGILKTEYKVMLTEGIEIEFDGKGNWEEIDGNKNALPNSVLTKTIASYIAANYKGQSVEKFEKETWGYKVDLLNGLDLEFDNNGKFLRIDD